MGWTKSQRPWAGRGPALCGCFPISIYISRKLYKLQKCVENTISLGKI
jgi:hypothetical protein